MARREDEKKASRRVHEDGAVDAKYKKTPQKGAAKAEPEKKRTARRKEAAQKPETGSVRAAAPKKKAGSAREIRRENRVQREAEERRRAISRRPGFGVTAIALLTLLFDVCGLMLCAANTQVAPTEPLGLMVTMAATTLLTTLVLPRWLPIDPLLSALTNFLCGVSVVILYTVSPDRGVRQAGFYAAGSLAMIGVSLVVSRLRRWKGLTLLAMALGMMALVLPLAFGEWQYGAKNWVELPLLGSFQPSEMVKLSLVLALAYYFSTHRTVWQMMPALVFAVVCLVLLMLQRDLGTALIYYITTLVMFYAACGNLPLTALGAGGGVAAAVMGYQMFSHVKVRVAMWRNPWSDPLEKGYQIIQGLLAIGSGGLFGVGLGQGTPKSVPAYFNDFIFAVVCEQLGQVFGIGVIVVYMTIILRGVMVSLRARHSFDMLLGCGVMALLGVQTFMIIAGVIKMIPLTGVTMPFLSYGGSSLISCLMMMGILHGIYARVQDDLETDILMSRR